MPGNDIVLTLDRSVQYASRAGAAEAGRRAGRQRRPGRRDGLEDRRGDRHGLGADQRRGLLRDHVRQLLGRRRLRARLGRQGDHHLRGAQRRHGHAGVVVRRAVAEGVHEPWRPPARLAQARRRGDERRADPRRVVEHRHDHGVRDDGLRAAVPLHADVRARGADGAQLPRRDARHPQPVAGVGRHREVHRRLRTGRRQQPDPAHLGGQHDRQRRHVRRAQAGQGDRRRVR